MSYKNVKVNLCDVCLTKDLKEESQFIFIRNFILNRGTELIDEAANILGHNLFNVEPIICMEKKDKYLVYRDFKRATAIKLLYDFELYQEIDRRFSASFIKLLDKFYHIDVSKVSIRILDSKEINKKSEVVYMEVKELEEEIMIKDKGKSSRAFELLEYVKGSELYRNNIKMSINSIRVSNLERLIEDPHVRESIGLTLRNKKLYRVVPEYELAKGLNKILTDLIDKDFKGTAIDSKEKRLSYIESFRENELPRREGYIEEASLEKEKIINGSGNIELATEQLSLIDIDKSNNFISEKKENKNNVEFKEIVYKGNEQRKYLIPSDFNLRVHDKAIESIYKELKTLDINRYGNAVEVLFLVFLERLLENYFEHKRINCEKGSSLIEKIKFALEYLEKEKGLEVNKDKKIVEKLKKNIEFVKEDNSFKAWGNGKRAFIDRVKLKEYWDILEPVIKVIIERK